MIPPNSRPDLPTFGVTRGRTVRVHLAFAAKAVSVSVDTKPIRTKLDAMKRIASWNVGRGGILTVSARAASTASYVARIRIH